MEKGFFTSRPGCLTLRLMLSRALRMGKLWKSICQYIHVGWVNCDSYFSGINTAIHYLVLLFLRYCCSGFIQASMSKNSRTFQGLLKATPTVFKDLKLMKILIQVLKCFFRNSRLR